MADYTNTHVAQESLIAEPDRAYWITSALLAFWGLGYAALVVEAFVIYQPEDFERLVRAGMILPGYSQYVQHLPQWIIGVAVFKAATRFAGGLGLLFQRSWAVPMYALSLAASCVIFLRGFLLDHRGDFEPKLQIGLEALFFALSVWAVWFAARALFRGTLR